MQRRHLLLASATLLPMAAHAHGEKAHGGGPIVKEQKDWGIAGDARQVRRTVDVRMGDNMRFTPARITAALGETIRFRVHNDGRVLHEFVIGTLAENARHAELMVRFPDMAHDEPHMAHVAAGRSGEIVWTFNRAGSFEFACLIAGHYSGGMKGVIEVRRS